MPQPVSQATFDQIAAQHDQLARAWSDVRTMLSTDRFHVEAVERELRELYRQLERHFQLEESAGFFEDIIARAPRLQREAEALRSQHRGILDGARRLRERVLQLDGDLGQVPAIRQSFKETLRAYFEHESAEDRLLEEAYCRDTPAGD